MLTLPLKFRRFVKVEDFFPDLKLFLNSVKMFMKNTESTDQPTFSEQDGYRLKKLMTKVREKMVKDG